MDANSFITGVLLIGILGLGGAVLGIFGLLTCRRHALGWHVASLVFAGLLVSCATLLAALGQPLRVWGPALALALLPMLCRAVQAQVVDRLSSETRRLLCRPELPWGLLLVAAVPVSLWCGAQHLAQAETALPVLELDNNLDRSQKEEVPGVSAVTDKGRHIPVYHFPLYGQDGACVGDSNIVREWAAKVIRTAPPGPACNCHGWVYTGGRFWISEQAVELILADNGYRAVPRPRVGDVIEYRDIDGRILHSGLVRVVQPGLVLIESKWGPLGCYLHRPEEQCYGQQFTYYRSSRPGHVLRGLEPPSGPTDSASKLDAATPTITASR